MRMWDLGSWDMEHGAMGYRTVKLWGPGTRVRGADAGLGQGGVLGIKIGWVCDLDQAWERCLPRYSFTRLDSLARTPAPGYNFRYGQDRHGAGVCTAWHGSCPHVPVSLQARQILPLAQWL